MTNLPAEKIKSFTDLDAWKKSHLLTISVYKLTKKFPKDETFGLISQMRRCSVSIVSNIAEGFTRPSKKEKMQFYSTAQASTTELQSQLLISRDVSYITNEQFQEIAARTVEVHMLINGLRRYIRNTKY